MLKMAVLVAITAFAFCCIASAQPIDPLPDGIGMYFDTEATISCRDFVGGPVTVYLVVTNPSIGSDIIGWECHVDYQVPAGSVEMGWTLMGNGFNEGVAPEFHVGVQYPLPSSDAVVLASYEVLAFGLDPMTFSVRQADVPSIPGTPVYVTGTSPVVLTPLHSSVNASPYSACLNCYGSAGGTPLVDPEPAITAGTSNEISWSGGAGFYLAQCARDALFTDDLRDSGEISSHQHLFEGLDGDQMYFYRVKGIGPCDETGWSDTESSTQTVVLGWVNLQWPPTTTTDTGEPTEAIYGQVWLDGVTNLPGQGGGIDAQLGYGPDSTDPSADPAWQWTDAMYNVDVGNNDEYMATLVASEVGDYDYCYRFRCTGGAWLYGDLDGSDNGYAADQAGALSVIQHAGPEMAPEPTYTQGLSNDVAWVPISASYWLLQRATDPDFATDLVEIEVHSSIHYEFTDLSHGITYYYRVREQYLNGEFTAWSNTVSSTQDALAPVSSAGPLSTYQPEMGFDVPYTVSDPVSGVASVELFHRLLGPMHALFDWEDGTSTVLGREGGPSTSNSTTTVHGGTHALRVRLGLFGDCTVYLAWVQGLSEGDEVTAGFWSYKQSFSPEPACRIWGRWNNDPLDIGGDDGDAGGNPDYTAGSGWSYQEHTWVVPAGHTGLVVEAEVVGGNFDTVYIDDMAFSVPGHATILMPDDSTAGPTEWHSWGSYTSSPISIGVPSEGTWGFYTVATDNVGNIEDVPVEPDAMTTVIIGTAVPDQPVPASEFTLHQNIPNPFNPTTKIRFDLPSPSRVGLHVYDVSGALVRILENAVHRHAGPHEVIWHGEDDDGRPVPSGTYFYRLTAGGNSETRRMVLVK